MEKAFPGAAKLLRTDKPINPISVDDVLEIYTSPPTEAEVLLQLP